MSLILLSRVATGIVIDGEDQYNSFYFNTVDPDGVIVVFTGIDTSAYERTLDELIYTDPSDGDTYRYDGDNGVNRTAGAGIPAPVYPNITTDYGLKYSLEYRDWENQIIREEIYEKDYVGAEIEIEAQAEPFILSRENEDDVFPRFRGSGATVNLKTPTSDFFLPLFSGDEREFFLIHKEAGTAKWTGWIQPDIYTEPYMPGPYQVSVRFSDGIALLKDTPFPDITLDLYTGTATEHDVIIECLKTLYTRLDVWIGLNIKSENMDGLSTPIEQSLVNMNAFVEVKNGETQPLSCYEVLNKVLTSWNAVLFQEDNHWTIIREAELYGGSVDYEVWNYQGISQSTSTWSTPQTFSAAGIKLHGALRESVQAYKNLSVSQEYGGLLVEKNNFAVNGDFENWEFIYLPPFTVLWRLKDWIYVNLELFPYEKFTRSVRRVEESLGIDRVNNYINIYGVVRSFDDTGVGYLESKPQPIKEELGNVINVSFKMRCNTAGSDQRLVEAYFNIALKCGTQWLAVNDTTGAYEWSGTETRVRWKVASVMVWENISIDSLPVPEDGDLSIRLYQIVQVGSVSKVQYVCDFDDVVVNLAENAAIVNQRTYYKTTNPENFTNTLPDLKIELGDALTILSQNAKIVDGQITELWTRPSESPGQPLAKLIAREYLNQYQSTAYKLTGGQCRTSLSLFNRYEDAVNMSGKYFIFSGGSFRAKSGYWEANFLQINQIETATEIREVFESRKDSSQGSSSGGDTGSAQPEAPSVTPPPNGITVRGTLVFNSAIEVVAAGYEWTISANPYEGASSTFAVTGTPTAYSRIDALVGNASSGYEWVTGTESEDSLIDPIIPDGKVLLEKILRETSGTNTLIPVDIDLSDYVDKTFTGNQEILSDFTIKPQGGTLPNISTFDGNGKLLRTRPALAGIFSTLQGSGGFSKILTITIDSAVQLNYFAVIQLFGISTAYEKGELWVQFTIDGSGDISQNSLKCFGEFDVTKYTLIKTSSTTYELFLAHDESVSFYKFRPLSQFGASTRYVYYNLEAKVDPLPAGTQYSFSEYGAGISDAPNDGLAYTRKSLGWVQSSPYDLKQEGATDGQVLAWSTANSRFEPTTSGGGGGTDANAVHYNVSDGKNATEQSQARTNIGSVGSSPQTVTSTGTINNLAKTSNYIIFTGASPVLTGIVAGVNGEEINIFYQGSGSLTISPNTGSTTANQIRMGDVLPNGGSQTLKYYGSKWVLVGNSLHKVIDTNDIVRTSPTVFGNIDFTGAAVGVSLTVKARSGTAASQKYFTLVNVSSVEGFAIDNNNYVYIGNRFTVANPIGMNVTYNAVKAFGGSASSTLIAFRVDNSINQQLFSFFCNGDLGLFDGGNLRLGTTTGTKFGTGTNQKLSFWNKTPIIQPTTGISAGTFIANTSGISDDTATFGGYTIGQIAQALINVGLLA